MYITSLNYVMNLALTSHHGKVTLRWWVTGKAYVIKLKELRTVNKWFTQLSNHRYTRTVYFDSLEIYNAAIDLASSSKYTIINGHNNRAQIE